jgi:hypothetical protein
LGSKKDPPQYVRAVALDNGGRTLGMTNVTDLDKLDINTNVESSDEDDSSSPPDEAEDGVGALRVGGWSLLAGFAVAFLMNAV